jgi:hypothetical protein
MPGLPPDESQPNNEADATTLNDGLSDRYRDRPSEDGKHGDAAEEQDEGAWSEGRDRETKKPRSPANS